MEFTTSGLDPVENDLVIEQMNRIVSSGTFRPFKRQCRVFRFLVAETLSGHAEDLKDSFIATKFYKGNDSAMRAEAGRIRTLLEAYYFSEGSRDPIRIEIPTGGYVPRFSRLPVAEIPVSPDMLDASGKEKGIKGERLQGIPPRIDLDRQQLLHLVRYWWIERILDKSLYRIARIDLGLEQTDDFVDDSLRLVVQELAKPPESLPAGTTLITLFDKHKEAGGLLVLGPPGGGKTTLLLELARDLLARASRDELASTPVVFNLSSWVRKRGSLSEWLVDELKGPWYEIRPHLARTWVDDCLILPLIDGLDEVADEHREACLECINEFRAHYHGPVVVCSRVGDYLRLSGRLKLPVAIMVQPLGRADIKQYLDRAGQQLRALRVLVENDSALSDVLNSPLMISVAMLAYQGMDERELLAAIPIRSRDQLFARYVDVMLKRRAKSTQYAWRNAMHWLTWLASLMQTLDQSDFRLEALNREWLPEKSLWFLDSIVMSISVLVSGSVFGLGVGVVVALTSSLLDGLGFALISILAFVVIRWRGPELGSKPVDSLHWSWSTAKSTLWSKRGRLFAVRPIGGFVARVTLPLAVGLAGGARALVALLVALLAVGGLIGLIVNGFVPAERKERATPNEGTWRSQRNALMGGGSAVLLAAGIVAAVGQTLGKVPVEWSLSGLIRVCTSPLAGALIGGLFAARIVGMFQLQTGGVFAVRHWVVRLCLWYGNYAPLNYTRFLDYAAERIFMYKVGGAYIFVHRMVRDYFASLVKDEASPRV